MATTRCKFRLDRIERSISSRKKRSPDGDYVTNDHGNYEYEPAEMHTLVMSPVYGNNDPNHENSKFWDASPGGEFRLNVVNAEAVAHMNLGAEYYIEITPAV